MILQCKLQRGITQPILVLFLTYLYITYCYIPVDGLTVVDGVVHGDVALERDAHGHEDGGGHGDGEEGEQEVREQDQVQLRRQLMSDE